MEIIISSIAAKRLQEIFQVTKLAENPTVFKALLKKKLNRIRLLKKNPNMGMEVKSLLFLNKNYRIYVCRNCKIIYRVIDNEILIDTIFDSKLEPLEMAKVL